ARWRSTTTDAVQTPSSPSPSSRSRCSRRRAVSLGFRPDDDTGPGRDGLERYLYDGPRSGARYSLVATDVSEQAGDRPSLRGSPPPGGGKSTTNQPRRLA